MIIPDGKGARERAARLISAGGVIAFRTDTFYGLGVDPLQKDAVSAIRKLKGREDDKPILLLISDMTQVQRFIANWSDIFDSLAKRFWPGPLTLVGAAVSGLPEELMAGTGSIGVRLPRGEEVQALLIACGGAVTATSANPSQHEPARSAHDVAAYFPAGIDLIIDGGDVTITEPSTVLDLTRPEPHLIREGIIKRDQLMNLLGKF